MLYVTTQFQYGRVAALLRYRNCAEITSPIRIDCFESQTRDIRSPSLPPKGALFAVYSTPVGIAREVDYRSRTWRFNNKAQLAFSAGVRLVSVGENQSD